MIPPDGNPYPVEQANMFLAQAKNTGTNILLKRFRIGDDTTCGHSVHIEKPIIDGEKNPALLKLEEHLTTSEDDLHTSAANARK